MTPSLGADARAAARIVLAGLVLLFGFTALYVTAFHAPRPKGLDVGYVGTSAQAARAQGALDAVARGGFDVRRYADESHARAALLDTDVRGVVVAGAPRDRILVAQALGAAPTETVTRALVGVAARTGAPPVVQDLRPLPAGDRRGLSPLFTVIGTLIPSLVFGVLLSVFGRRLAGRARWAAVAVYAVLAGLVAAFNVDVLVGALTGDFAGIALVCGLLALAVSAAAHGLGHLGGPAGIVVAVLMLMLLGVSTAGGAVTYEFEPGFYGAISQFLAPGAALTALRNVQYFDWAATLEPFVVLGAWAAGGVALGLLGERFGPHVRAAARASAAALGAPATAGSRA
ncbi:MAG: hypothetical protein ACXVFT_28555 [Solirubrobacteraceae bacterium]